MTTTNNDILIEHIEVLKKENSELKKQNKAKSGFTLFETRWWSINGVGVGLWLMIAPIIFGILFCCWTVIMGSELVGNFYINGSWRRISGTQRREKVFCVMQEVNWGLDSDLDCSKTVEEAYESALNHKIKWEKLQETNKD